MPGVCGLTISPANSRRFVVQCAALAVFNLRAHIPLSQLGLAVLTGLSELQLSLAGQIPRRHRLTGLS